MWKHTKAIRALEWVWAPGQQMHHASGAVTQAVCWFPLHRLTRNPSCPYHHRTTPGSASLIHSCQIFTKLFLTIGRNLLATKASYEYNFMIFSFFFLFLYIYSPQWNAKFHGGFSLNKNWVE